MKVYTEDVVKSKASTFAVRDWDLQEALYRVLDMLNAHRNAPTRAVTVAVFTGLPTCLRSGAWLGVGYEYTILHAAPERLPFPS